MMLRELKGILATVVCLLLTIGGAFGQSTEETYRLLPEDVLRIQVYEHPELSADTVPIGRDGNINAPFTGTVHAEGMTVAELAKELEKRYVANLRIREPRVSVIIVQYRASLASVGGAVSKPGRYPIRPGDTILTLLHQAGDAPSQTADLRRATFRRSGSSEAIPIDLYAMMFQMDLSQNYVVRDGDELTVPEETRNHISVMGLVQRPGLYPYKEPLYLSDAIAMSGGEVHGRSRLSKTMVYRRKPGASGEMVRIHTDFVRFQNGDFSQNIELQPEDIVWVPETNTPDWNQIGSIANSLFFFDNFFRNGIFGFRPFH